MSIRSFVRHREFLEWKVYECHCTNGGCGDCVGGKNVFDLREVTTLDVGYAKDDPCFARHMCDNVMWA